MAGGTLCFIVFFSVFLVSRASQGHAEPLWLGLETLCFIVFSVFLVFLVFLVPGETKKTQKTKKTKKTKNTASPSPPGHGLGPPGN